MDSEKKFEIIPDGIYMEKDHILVIVNSIKKKFNGNSKKLIKKATDYFQKNHPKENRKK